MESAAATDKTASPYLRTNDVLRRVDVSRFGITSSPIYSRFKPRERAQTTRGGTLTHSLLPSTVFPGKFSRVVGIESIILKYSTTNASAGLTASWLSSIGLPTRSAPISRPRFSHLPITRHTSFVTSLQRESGTIRNIPVCHDL